MDIRKPDNTLSGEKWISLLRYLLMLLRIAAAAVIIDWSYRTVFVNHLTVKMWKYSTVVVVHLRLYCSFRQDKWSLF